MFVYAARMRLPCQMRQVAAKYLYRPCLYVVGSHYSYRTCIAKFSRREADAIGSGALYITELYFVESGLRDVCVKLRTM